MLIFLKHIHIHMWCSINKIEMNPELVKPEKPIICSGLSRTYFSEAKSSQDGFKCATVLKSTSGVDRHGRTRSGDLRGRDAALTCQVGNQSASQPVRIQPVQVEKSHPNHTKSTSGETSSRRRKRHQQLMVIRPQPRTGRQREGR